MQLSKSIQFGVVRRCSFMTGTKRDTDYLADIITEVGASKADKKCIYGRDLGIQI